MASKKRLLRKARTAKRKIRTVGSGQVGLSDLQSRLKAAPDAGGPILNIRPNPKVLQRLIPPSSIVTVKSGVISRGEGEQPYIDLGGAGFGWDVPAPDPNLGTVVWATISFDWAFYGWQSERYTEEQRRR
jgi:hypothetical protein